MIKKLFVIIVLFSMLSACVVRPAHKVDERRSKLPVKAVVHISPPVAKKAIVAVGLLPERSKYCRRGNVYHYCRR